MRKKALDIIFLILICGIVTVFGIAIFVLPKRDFSDKENRYLAELPALSAEAVVTGDYFKNLSDFYSDQFPLRDSFTSVHALAELSLGKQEVNGIIKASNGALVARPDRNVEDLALSIRAIEEIEGAYLYVPPRSADIFASALPFSPRTALPSNVRDNIESFPKENTYYKTDHHWTTKGAYTAYLQICEDMGIEVYGEDYFTQDTVSTDFRGTSFSRSGLPAAMVTPDCISLYRYDGDTAFRVLNHETEKVSYGFYSFDALDTVDKYRVFLGGNYSHLSISTGTERPRLLLIKDSFANSVVPFLALHFDIEMIDPRYCTHAYLDEQLARDDIDQILFLLSEDTLKSLC